MKFHIISVVLAAMIGIVMIALQNKDCDEIQDEDGTIRCPINCHVTIYLAIVDLIPAGLDALALLLWRIKYVCSDDETYKMIENQTTSALDQVAESQRIKGVKTTTSYNSHGNVIKREESYF